MITQLTDELINNDSDRPSISMHFDTELKRNLD